MDSDKEEHPVEEEILKLTEELSILSVIPKSCHHHVIRPLTYLLALNPIFWSED